jgi:hypothetical protein
LPTHPTGDGIQLGKSYGATFGRFDAAGIAARMFPNRQAFVDAVAIEGILLKEASRSTRTPRDRIASWQICLQ